MTPEQIASFQTAYVGWIEKSRPALNEHRWKEAFVGFPSPDLAPVPLAPVAKPLARLKLGLFSTAGLYVKARQPPFDASNVEGDASHRQVPVAAPRETLAIAHEHYDHAAADQDLDAVFPARRLREEVAAGRLGALAEVAMSTSGYCTRLDRIAAETAPRIAAEFKALGVDAVLHVPV